MLLSLALCGIVFLISHENCQGYNLQNNKMRIAIRKRVLNGYDKIIGPVKFGLGVRLKVEFRLSVSNLVEVNTRDQVLKIDGWILQKWKDEFLSWKSKDFKNVFFTVFGRNEIWVPDTVLLNNADSKEKLAGGPTKFMTNVNAYKSGQMTWLAPASFTSTCQQNVKTWPMDTQECTLEFGSCMYADKNLVLVPINQTYVKGSIANGEWTIDNIKVFNGTTDHQKCCDKTYSTINYKITLTRKPDYFVFYLAPPTLILAFLAMMSFCIPTESGERIGFITTILLALMVFLLMIPEYLPKTSDQLPVLGILFVLVMVMICSILVATIFVLMCYHSEGSPPAMLQRLLFPIKTRFKSKKFDVTQPGKVNMATELNKIEDERKDISSEEAFATRDDYDVITWQKVASKMNWIFFVTIFLVTLAVILFLMLKA